MKKFDLDIPLSGITLKGDLVIPEKATGIVVFSHGSGSSRFSPRNRMVAELIQKQNIATFMFDLLTEEEDHINENRFNIDLLANRLIETTQWLMEHEDTKSLLVGYFGASTGAASALRAAAHFREAIKAVVSRGGRPDLTLTELPLVTAPTLLIVGGLDTPVIPMNKMAYDKLESVKDMKIVEGATHLFEEPGKLLEVADLAIDWYKKYLTK
ncbi:MAG TPA: dienelactone hydrolase family protein [Flavobacterium sp.]|uniref:dienelactone hydrolase family protein n=1 Tax=Flavobacterium sp. TaxID=239 RepID=UPI001B6B29C2|nr:dienelactone hydrolase family protein [Flavobacterium sp.]MBP7183411.1 dienelactone hydrolase family protein [Flavobacterium sp.]MBP8886900.1 dienelactone hydrolase family protein [Flavobacterium sp.]HRL72140.1 dienelactone hydrolase family protein [Flavobacterium sp.]HRM12543.1 dienelactone hydrolase family protein [Flavobacterium sp.]